MRLLLLISLLIFSASNCLGQTKTLGNDDFSSGSETASVKPDKFSNLKLVEQEFSNWRVVDEPVPTAEGTMEVRYNLTSKGWIYGIQTSVKANRVERKGVWVGDRKKLTELNTMLVKVLDQTDVTKGATPQCVAKGNSLDLCGASFTVEKVGETDYYIKVKSGTDCDATFTAEGTLTRFTIKSLQTHIEKVLADTNH